MLIPIPVLGAVIGSAIGGIAVGLYQRIVIPRSKASILKMLSKLEQFKSDDGQILYSEDTIKILKISGKHFHKNKPEELSDSDWLTLITLHLTNEVFYLSFLENQNKNLKLRQKLEAAPEDKDLEKELQEVAKQFLDIEERKKPWEPLKAYVEHHQLSSLRFGEQIGKFVDGMICNFKV